MFDVSYVFLEGEAFLRTLKRIEYRQSVCLPPSACQPDNLALEPSLLANCLTSVFGYANCRFENIMTIKLPSKHAGPSPR